MAKIILSKDENTLTIDSTIYRAVKNIYTLSCDGCSLLVGDRMQACRNCKYPHESLFCLDADREDGTDIIWVESKVERIEPTVRQSQEEIDMVNQILG